MRFSRIITFMSIKNEGFHPCTTCKFHKPQYYTAFESPLSDCQAVGERNVITGEIDYVSVSQCRMYECGMNGKLYEPEPHVLSKKIKHAVVRYLPYALPLLVYACLIYSICIQL
jgi:hypothetical protein